MFIVQNIFAFFLSIYEISDFIKTISKTLNMKKQNLLFFLFDSDLFLNALLLLLSLIHFIKCISVSIDTHHSHILSYIYYWILFFKYLQFIKICIGPFQFETFRLLLDILSDFNSVIFMYLSYIVFHFLCFQLLMILTPLCFDNPSSTFKLLSSFDKNSVWIFFKRETQGTLKNIITKDSLFDNNISLFSEFLINERFYFQNETLTTPSKMAFFQSIVTAQVFISKIFLAPMIFFLYLKVKIKRNRIC